MKYSRPRGTQDFVPPEIEIWRSVEAAFQRAFDRFGYQGIRTPVFESTELFVRAVGEQSDIISKEMYTFTDRGGRSLTLRPENTASVIRAYLEHGMHRLGGIVRLCYQGPMFRYDRPQTGRYRQFHQVGAEAIGSDSPAVDVEMIQLVMSALSELGFNDLVVRINSIGDPRSREPYRKLLLEKLDAIADQLPEDIRSRYRHNPLRVFDYKGIPEIKKQLPLISEHLDPEAAEHYARVKALLGAAGIPFQEDPQLVRGLDYYTHTTFEIHHESLGAQNALCGGGRYDHLVEECGGPATPAMGFSAGLERIISVLPQDSPAVTGSGASVDYYVVCVGEFAAERAIKVAVILRELGNVEVDYSGRAIKKQLRAAEKKGAKVAVIVDDANPDALGWRDMERREQSDVGDDAVASFASQRGSEKGSATRE